MYLAFLLKTLIFYSTLFDHLFFHFPSSGASAIPSPVSCKRQFLSSQMYVSDRLRVPFLNTDLLLFNVISPLYHFFPLLPRPPQFLELRPVDENSCLLKIYVSDPLPFPSNNFSKCGPSFYPLCLSNSTPLLPPRNFSSQLVLPFNHILSFTFH